MNKITTLTCLIISTVGFAQTNSFHDFSAPTILGDTISMQQYAGKKLLVVNTASYCEFTHQFSDLQQLDSTYASYNFEVIGFPSNDFGAQDPGTDGEIFDFCSSTYGVTFQMMSRVSISAVDTCDIYKWLQRGDLNGVSDAPVTWNFHKFCIDEQGNWIMHFPSDIEPNDPQIIDWIVGAQAVTESEPNKGLQVNVRNQMLHVQTDASWNGIGTIEIYSADGKHATSVYSGELRSMNTDFNLPALANGVYLIEVRNQDRKACKRVGLTQ